MILNFILQRDCHRGLKDWNADRTQIISVSASTIDELRDEVCTQFGNIYQVSQLSSKKCSLLPDLAKPGHCERVVLVVHFVSLPYESTRAQYTNLLTSEKFPYPRRITMRSSRHNAPSPKSLVGNESSFPIRRWLMPPSRAEGTKTLLAKARRSPKDRSFAEIVGERHNYILSNLRKSIL